MLGSGRTTTPRGLPARGPRTAPGSVTSAALATGGLSFALIANCTSASGIGFLDTFGVNSKS